MNLIKAALESIETLPSSSMDEATPITPAAKLNAKMQASEKQTKLTGTELKAEPTILMNGPLSTIFTRALRIAYAKVDQTSGEVTSITPGDSGAIPTNADGSGQTPIAMETQANDYINAAMAQQEKKSAFPQSGVPQGTDDKTVGSNPQDAPTTISGLKPVPITKDEAIAIFQAPDNIPSDYMDVVFYTDATAPTAYSPMGEVPGKISMIDVGQNSNNWRTSIESISIHVKTKQILIDE